MATLQVTNLQNTASTVTNISLLADGTTTLALNATGTARTGGIRYNAGTLELYDGTAWVAVGGGSGPAAATLAEAAAGTLNTVFSSPLTAVPKDASGMAGAALLPGSAVAYAGTPATGMIRYNNSAPPAYLEYYDGTSWVTVSTGAPPSLSAASLAEAATGVTTAKYSSPETAVPKDASGMTGAAILPSGTDLQRAAISSPVAGMTRFNTDYVPDSLEVYNGTTWKQLAYVADAPSGLTDLTVSASGPLTSGTYNNITIDPGVTATIEGEVNLVAYGSVTVNGTIDGIGNGLPGTSSGGSSNGVWNISPGQGLGAGTRSPGPSTSWRSIFGGTGSPGSWMSNSGGGGTSTGGSTGAALIVRSLGPIIVNSTAVIDCSGEQPPASTISGADPGAGGGGGGSGGLIVLESKSSLTLAAGSVLSVNGGAGRNGVRGGTQTTAGGGGGGGGGYIVLNSPATTDSSTKNVAGGAAGARVGSGVPRGGNGGGFAGAGGSQGSTTVPTAGAAGTVILNDYL